MKVFLLFCILFPGFLHAQSDALQYVEEHYDVGTFGKMVFYYSTLKMWIPEDDAELKQIIHDVEKIVLIRLEEDAISQDELATIEDELDDEGYEEAVRISGPDKRLNIYIKDGKGLFLIGGLDGNVMILDVKGTIPVDKIFTLQDKMHSLTENTDFLENFRD